MDNEVFDYKLFHNNEWKKPWTNQELYENVINIIHDLDVQNSILNKAYDHEEEEED